MERPPAHGDEVGPRAEAVVREGDLALSLVTTVTAFSAPGNVAAEELRIESYYPLDDATAEAFARRP